MKYLSTRGHPDRRRFCEILLEGLAPDGGLYLPEIYPQVDAATLERWHGLSYPQLAFEILSLYIDDIPAADLMAICERSYTPEIFGNPAIAPVRKLEQGLYIQELSNGPTLAFKDMAMQFLGNLLEYEMERRQDRLYILGATSGDTGSAAEHALRGRKRIRVIMMSPKGRMSAFQQAQMFSLQDENIHNLAIEGVFDDCQDIVKSVSGDLNFKRRNKIGAVNSINWARVVAQVVYYFAGYLQVSAQGAAEVDFTVPSGNFGNICAGHVARMMGLPIKRLVVATNENDVLDEFFRTGRYRPRGPVDTHETSSPSMDISKASNLERFVFDLLGRDAARTKDLFDSQLRARGQFDLGGDAAFGQGATVFGFRSGKSTHADRLATIRDVWLRHESVIDPHTADGITVARRLADPQRPMIVLETALPVKFAATIREALNRLPDCPERFKGLEDLPQRLEYLPADAEVVKRYIETVAQNSAIESITNQPDADRSDKRLDALPTPCLILDRDRMDRNVARLRARLERLGPSLRPHLKTAKSPDAARRVMTTAAGPATVSTLKEAEEFAAAGVTDITYAVGIAPDKLGRVLALRAAGVDLAVTLDTVAQAVAVAEASRGSGDAIPALIEIDCDGHRSGVLPGDRNRLLAIAEALASGGSLRGVLTHAGDSYGARGADALRACAEGERASVVEAAAILREAGYECPVVSVGSTPTAHFTENLDGVTEMRAGVFVFFDLVMAGIGVCQIDDIAVSVLATVIGHQPEKGWILVDAGWMAMSRDRGTSKQAVDQGYGLVCDIDGNPLADMIMADANQEHGILALRPGAEATLPDLPIGTRVRILPNHACATGAQHDRYHVLHGGSRDIKAIWPRFGGW